MLPLGWLTFFLIIFIPGFTILVLLKDQLSIVEIIGFSGAFSILLLPLSTSAISLFSVLSTNIILGILTSFIGIYGLFKKRRFTISRVGWPLIFISFILFIVALYALSIFFTTTSKGFSTGSFDQIFHLSIIQRYIVHPQIPPQDPYSLGNNMVYNWFMYVTLGELSLHTGLNVFSIYKVFFTLLFPLIFLNVFLLSQTIFKNNLRASAVSSILYISTAGLSWILILYTLFNYYSGVRVRNITGYVFGFLVYAWPNSISLKYDPVSFYFLVMPQPQTLGLLATIFVFYTYLLTFRNKSWKYAIVCGLGLASLVFYHLITVFPVFMALGLFFIYIIINRKNAIIDKDRGHIIVLALPLIIGSIAALVQFVIRSSTAESQVALGHHPDVFITILVTLGLFIPFALWAMYKNKDNNDSKLLILFAFLNFLFVNILEMSLTNNTYRFLVYMTLPITLFAGFTLDSWLHSKKRRNIIVALIIILLMIPSSFGMVFFSHYLGLPYASNEDQEALHWINNNTPKDAVFFESPLMGPEIPLFTGRQVLYAGPVYSLQYHGINNTKKMLSMMDMTDSDTLYRTMKNYGINYILITKEETKYLFSSAVIYEELFQEVYNNSNIKIYKIN